jgi:hypothetical protein
MYLLCDAIPWIEHRRDDLLGHDDAAAHAARKNKILIWELWNDKEYFRWIFLVVLRVRSGGDESSLVAGVLALKNANFIRQNGSTSRTFFQDCAVSHSESMWQMKGGGGGGLARCEGRFSHETPGSFLRYRRVRDTQKKHRRPERTERYVFWYCLWSRPIPTKILMRRWEQDFYRGISKTSRNKGEIINKLGFFRHKENQRARVGTRTTPWLNSRRFPKSINKSVTE